MHDDDQDLHLIDDAFSAFRAGGPVATPVGADAARATVRYRRRVRTMTAGVLAALALVVPAAAYATNRIDTEGPPPDKVGDSSAPSAGPSASDPTQSQTPPPPDGHITVEQLAHATVDFGTRTAPGLCPTGAFTFDGFPTSFHTDTRVAVSKVVDVDVDRDGTPETVAWITCAIQGRDSVVVALDRDASGKIITIGTVVATSEEVPVRTVFDVRADAAGSVGVQVGDKGQCCGTVESSIEHQWRSFRLAGSRFEQSGGPTAFTPLPARTNLKVTMTAVTLGAPTGGVRLGSITITVRNDGPAVAPGAVLGVQVTAAQGLPADVQLTSALNDCATSTDTGDNGRHRAWRLECHLFSFAAGESRNFTFRVASPVANDDAIRADAGRQFHEITADADVVAEQPGVRVLHEQDLTQEDNSVSANVTLAS